MKIVDGVTAGQGTMEGGWKTRKEASSPKKLKSLMRRGLSGSAKASFRTTRLDLDLDLDLELALDLSPFFL